MCDVCKAVPNLTDLYVAARQARDDMPANQKEAVDKKVSKMALSFKERLLPQDEDGLLAFTLALFICLAGVYHAANETGQAIAAAMAKNPQGN